MKFRQAVKEDIPEIMLIINDAQKFLKEQGVDQWQDGFPDASVIERDILENKTFVLVEQEEILAYVTIRFLEEESYRTLYGGRWLLSTQNYAVIHRTAVKAGIRGEGIGRKLFDFCEEIARREGAESLRIIRMKRIKSCVIYVKKKGLRPAATCILATAGRNGWYLRSYYFNGRCTNLRRKRVPPA